MLPKLVLEESEVTDTRKRNREFYMLRENFVDCAIYKALIAQGTNKADLEEPKEWTVLAEIISSSAMSRSVLPSMGA